MSRVNVVAKLKGLDLDSYRSPRVLQVLGKSKTVSAPFLP